ncbi:hypothetical protein Rhal01_02406 [Rubritalea halochordaticola]|uniref:Uncharacterized protein n=1 Tax=Rubritalea halochordaticola TaxID=714537 RepID=A0ABP9V2S5_9BACT
MGSNGGSLHEAVDLAGYVVFLGCMSIERIVTHPGGAHKDDFLACSLLVHHFGVGIDRREPSEEDVANPNVCVVDVGEEHDEEKRNFDHHQFPRDYEPTCALSLVLRYLGLYEDARLYCDWLETAEWMDTRGPVKTAKWLGVERDAMAKLNSPIDVTMLRRFAKQDKHEPGEPIWELMKMMGSDLVEYLEGMRARMNFISEHAQVWEIEEGFKVLFMPRTEPLPTEPSAGLGRYIESVEEAQGCVGMVYPDRRGEGYGLTRFNDDLRLEFTRVEAENDVHFAHVAGFVAKTSATEESRLRELLAMSWLGGAAKE